MKLIISNLSDKNEFEIEIESGDSTIKEVKQEISKKLNLAPAGQKLIFNGEILSNDSKTLDSYKIGPSAKLLLAKDDSSSNGAPTKNIDVPPKYKTQLQSLLDMGFEKEKALAALKAARGHTELAIEYYYNDDINQGDGEDDENDSDENAVENDQGYSGEDGEKNLIDKDFNTLLEKTAGIIKIICQEKNLQPNDVMKIVKQKNPYLYQIIKDSYSDFSNFLQSPISKKDYEAYNDFKSNKGDNTVYNLRYQDFMNPGMDQAADEEQEDDEDDDEDEEIVLTDKDKQVINRLKDLGDFKEEEVIHAYLKCGKNEELAADFLFENQPEDEAHHPLDD